jgi:hypothetical protein
MYKIRTRLCSKKQDDYLNHFFLSGVLTFKRFIVILSPSASSG